MKKPEQLAWTIMRREMSGYWVAQRHEDRFTSGIPDVSFVMIDGRSGWVELKAGERFSVAAEQIQWMVSRAQFGQCCILAARGEGGWLAVRVTPINAPMLRTATRAKDLAAIGYVGTAPEVIEKCLQQSPNPLEKIE